MNQEDFFALSSFMIYPQVCNESNMMAAISGAGTAYPYRASEFTPVLVGSFCQFFSFLCSSLSFRSLDCPSLIQLLITCEIWILSHKLLILTKNVLKEDETILKKSLKIPKGLSESVYRRRTDNTMAKKKYKRTSNNLQSIHIKLKIE